MAVETDDMRLWLLEDWGVNVTYTVQGGQAKTIKAVFDNDFNVVDAGGEFGFATQMPRLVVRTSDVVAGTEGDTYVVQGVTYLSRVVQDDGTGMTVVQLEKQ